MTLGQMLGRGAHGLPAARLPDPAQPLLGLAFLQRHRYFLAAAGAGHKPSLNLNPPIHRQR